MNRRALVGAIPSGAMLLAMQAFHVSGASAAETTGETPILRLFHQHRAIAASAAGHICNDADEDEEMERVFWREADQLERQMMVLPCVCAADFAAKMIVSTARGQIDYDWKTGAIWAEARALTGSAI